MWVWRSFTAFVHRVSFNVLPAVSSAAVRWANASPQVLLSSGDPTPATPEYDPKTALSTVAKFPWMWTAVNAVAGDLAGLPLIAVKKVSSGKRRRVKRETVEDKALELLEQPNASESGTLFRKQLAVDWLLTGNAYIWKASADAIYRLHPSRTVPLVGLFGVVLGFEHWDGRQTRKLTPDEVVHIRDVSWQDTAAAAVGESVVRCLHDDLMTEMASRELAAKQAKRGRPHILFKVKTANLSPNARKDILESWDAALKNDASAFAYGRDIEAQAIGWSPEEFKFQERSEWTREEILAVFEVPPARAGLTSANYGTQKQQMRTYAESLARRAAFFNDAFSRLAAAGVRILHDFSEVEALQASVTERLMHVQAWHALGATPAAAAAYEQFDDAPVPDTRAEDGDDAEQVRRPARPRPEEPQGDKTAAFLPLSLLGYFREAAIRYEAAVAKADEGVDTSLLTRWETERLFAVLTAAGLDHAVARTWAEEIVGITSEGVAIAVRAAGDDELDVGELELFSPERAQRLALQIRRSLEEAA